MKICNFTKHQNQKGVTLVELLIVMGLLSILLVLLTTMFTATIDTQSRSRGYSAVTTDSRIVLARINYDLQRATAVTTPAALGASSTSLALTINGNPYTYDISGGKLRITDIIGTADLTGEGVIPSGLTFQRLGNVGGKESVRYSFTLTGVVQSSSGPSIQSYTSTVERR